MQVKHTSSQRGGEELRHEKIDTLKIAGNVYTWKSLPHIPFVTIGIRGRELLDHYHDI